MNAMESFMVALVWVVGCLGVAVGWINVDEDGTMWMIEFVLSSRGGRVCVQEEDESRADADLYGHDHRNLCAMA